MLVKTHAIVLSRLKYGEADLIVKCYTLSDGIKSYILRGVLKSRKGKFRVAYFQPLTILQLDVDHKPLRDLNYIREVKPVVHPVDNTQDVVRGGIVMFLSEVLTHVLKEEESNPLLFEFLETSIHWLNETDYPNNFHLKFLIELTKYLGFYPDIPDRLPSEAVFDLQRGDEAVSISVSLGQDE